VIKIPQTLKSLARKTIIPINALTILAVSFGYGQNYTLQGKVTILRDSTGDPIENVKIDVDSSSYIAKTNVNGNYLISGIPSGQHNIRISKGGYVGFFETGSNANITSNETLNFTMPETTQTVPKGIGTIKASKMIDLYSDSSPKNKDPAFADYPMNTFLSNATAYDSLIFREALGNGLTSWQDSDTTSMEYFMQEKRYQLTSDSADVINNGGVLINCNSPHGDMTAHSEVNGKIFWISINVAGGEPIAVWQHEEGFGNACTYVLTFSSRMEATGYPPAMTLDDNILTKTAERHHKAKVRGEQNAFLLNIEDYITPIIPSVPTPSSPVNNSVKEFLDNTLKWSKIFGTDEYHVQIATDAGFTDLILDDSLAMKTSETVSNLPSNTDLYWRVQSKNIAGTGSWSSTFKFTTGSVLPVELTTFNGYANKNKITLDWITATEIDNYGFEIQKKVNDSWTKVGFVDGHGTSNVKNEYHFNYNDPKFGTEEFRLKQIDRDGKFEYSKEIELQTSSPVENIVAQNYPNPFNPQTTIAFTIPYPAFVTIKVFNALGEQVATLESERLAAGMYTTEWNASRFASGLYFYRVQADGLIQTRKIVLLR